MSFLSDYPLRNVSFVLHVESNSYFHYFLATQCECVSITFCLYLLKCFIGSLVKLQLNYEHMVVGFESDVCAPLCCSLLHNDAIVGKESEDDVEHLLIMPLI